MGHKAIRPRRRPPNNDLLERLRMDIGPRADSSEKRMFGGVAFLIAGKMACGVIEDDLMIRLAPDDFEEESPKAHARPMDFSGRPLRGFLFVRDAGWKDDGLRRPLVAKSVDYAASLAAAK